jgi:hypothetical protein
MDIEKKLKELKKGKDWCIRGAYQPAVERISYKKMMEYCEIIYLMGIEKIIVEYIDEDKVYIFEYDYDLEEVLLIDEEDC